MNNMRSEKLETETDLVQKRESLAALKRNLLDAEEINKELGYKISEQHMLIGEKAHEEDLITNEMADRQARLF